MSEAKSGPGNWASTPREDFRRHVREAGSGLQPVAVCGCFAGLLTAVDKRECEAELADAFPGAVVEARPDYHAVLAGHNDPEAIGLIAGTGSLVFSFVGERIVKSGGGGALLGDEGSAFRMGRGVVRRYLFENDQSLRDEVGAVLGATEENDLIAAIYRSGAPAGQVAKLAQVAARRAQDGETWAGTLTRQELQALALVAERHAQRHHAERAAWKVAVAGGLWDIHPWFEAEFREILAKSEETRWSFGRMTGAPAEGAALLALRLRP